MSDHAQITCIYWANIGSLLVLSETLAVGVMTLAQHWKLVRIIIGPVGRITLAQHCVTRGRTVGTTQLGSVCRAGSSARGTWHQVMTLDSEV